MQLLHSCAASVLKTHLIIFQNDLIINYGVDISHAIVRLMVAWLVYVKGRSKFLQPLYSEESVTIVE